MKNINRKNITNIKAVYKQTNQDYLRMGFLVNKLVEKNDLGKLNHYLKEPIVNENMKIFEIMLKIDKTLDKINNITTRMQRKIMLVN